MAKASRKTAAAKSTPILQNGKVLPKGRNRKASEPRSRAAPSPSIPPRRQSNLDRRTREYLTPAEVEKLLQASAKVGRHGARDRTLILLAYRHALRVSELVTMRCVTDRHYGAGDDRRNGATKSGLERASQRA